MKRSRFIRLAALSVLSLFILGGVLSAQSAPDAVGAYQARMQTYKDHLKELRSLKEEYQTAAPERKDEIQAKFNPLLAETSTLQKSLVPLAIEAFKSLDSQDEELSVFLMSMLDKMVVTTEEYETAYSIAKALDGAIPEQYSYLSLIHI